MSIAENDLSKTDQSRALRDAAVARIYETVLRPALYDDFMEAWQAHVDHALQDLAELREDGGAGAAHFDDPDLKEHFERAGEILLRMGRSTDAPAPPARLHFGPGGALKSATPPAQALFNDVRTLTDLAARLEASSAQRLAESRRDLARGAPIAPLVLIAGSAPHHLLLRSTPPPEAGLLVEPLQIQWSAALERILASSFQLSPAEADVVRSLLAGRTSKEIAAASGRSEHTIRNQTKSILAKTGTTRQTDLIRLVAFLSQLDAEAHPVNAGPGILRFGAKRGAPVVFLHGMLDGVATLRLNDSALAHAGLTVFAPFRPGFDAVPPATSAAHGKERYVSGAIDTIQSEGLPPVVLLGHMAGAIYAHAIAARAPDLVRGILSVSGAVPITGRRQFQEMGARQRVVALTARYAPALLPSVLRAGIAQIDSDDAEAFLTALFPVGTPDHKAIQQAGSVDLVIREFRRSTAQGPGGFALDSYFVVRNWSSDVAAHTVPTLCLHGRHDRAVSARSVDQFAAAHPHVTARVDPRLGQLILQADPDEVIAQLTRMARA